MKHTTVLDTEIVELMTGATKELTDEILAQNSRVLAMNERILSVLLNPMVRINQTKGQDND